MFGLVGISTKDTQQPHHIPKFLKDNISKWSYQIKREREKTYLDLSIIAGLDGMSLSDTST